MCAGAANAGRSVLEWLLTEAPDLALTAVATAVAALWWPDSDSGAKATAFCRFATSCQTQSAIALRSSTAQTLDSATRKHYYQARLVQMDVVK